jgi:hypothetical protein
MCQFCVTNLPLKQYVQIKRKLTVSNFSFFITIHNGFVIVDSNCPLSLAFIGPYIIIYFYSKTNKMHQFLNLFILA